MSGLELKLESHVVLQVGNPFGMASLKLTIFVCIRGQSLESRSIVALLVLLEMLSHVVTHESLEQVQLEVVLFIELLAFLSLQECVVIVLVAFVGESHHELLLALHAKFRKDALLEVHLHSLHGTLHLQ